MEDSLINKLKKFLSDHDPVTEECHVVYLLVEIRKLMDRIECKEDKYKILRFYCNWALHTKKSRQLDVISSVVTGIEESIFGGHASPDGQFWPSGNSHVQFIYKKELQQNMTKFFSKYSLPTDIFTTDKWKRFISLLIQVLIDQPIELNGKKIKSLCFRTAYQAANLEVTLYDDTLHRFVNVL